VAADEEAAEEDAADAVAPVDGVVVVGFLKGWEDFAAG
jgi:hypothetical protein